MKQCRPIQIGAVLRFSGEAVWSYPDSVEVQW